MPEVRDLISKLEVANRRVLLLVAGIAYIVLGISAFVALSLFLDQFLAAVVAGQSYSVAVQEWRGALNGISAGWRFFPELDGLCIKSGNEILAMQYFCPDANPIFGTLSGTFAISELNGFEIRASLRYSLWIWAIFAPVIALIPILPIYQIVRRLVSTRVYLEAVEQIKAVDSSQQNLTDFQRIIQAQMSEILELKGDAMLAKMAAQLAHDIRSPLSALNMMLGSIKELPEDRRLIIRNAVQRINDIANGLVRQGKKQVAHAELEKNAEHQPLEPQMLVALLDSMISEKRVQFRDRMEVEIQGDLNRGYGLFAKIDAIEFGRVISNLVNNSVEAFDHGGRVTIGIVGNGDKIIINLEDNGRGMSADLLERLGARGVTHGKKGTESGSGLGVYHARQTLERAGGRVSFHSTVGVGTRVEMTLPKSETPKWFVEKLILVPGSTLVSVDDDQTIHQIWSGRLASAEVDGHRIQHLRFSNVDQFEAWIRDHRADDIRYLIDYEFLHQAGSGLDVIENLGLANKAVLVTSRYEERYVRDRAAGLGVRILPKGLAPLVPIEITKRQTYLDAVLIDDDTLMHMTWQMAAQEKAKNVRCFVSPEEFYEQASAIDPRSPIFIDVSLADGVRGEDVAVKVVALGFTEIYLSTGHDPLAINAPPGVRQVIGKEPVFI